MMEDGSRLGRKDTSMLVENRDLGISDATIVYSLGSYHV
jgi:hypothetical protein